LSLFEIISGFSWFETKKMQKDKLLLPKSHLFIQQLCPVRLARPSLTVCSSQADFNFIQLIAIVRVRKRKKLTEKKIIG
jgi:hypothetical protein